MAKDIYVDSAATGSNNGQSWANAFTSLNNALSTGGGDKVVAGDTILCKGSVLEVVNLAVAATSAAPILVRGDDGTGSGASPVPTEFTVDGEGSHLCIDSAGPGQNYIFIDITCDDSDAAGWNLVSENIMSLIRCKATNNADAGIVVNNNCVLINCTAFGNGGFGMLMDTGNLCVGCVSHNNNGGGFSTQFGVFVGCLAYKNEGVGFRFESGASNMSAAINCTVDGDKSNITASAIGVQFQVLEAASHVINCILHDCDTGIDSPTDEDASRINMHNLFNNNTNDVVNFPASLEGKVSAVPGFVNEAGEDYRLASGSAAKAAGIDAGKIVS